MKGGIWIFLCFHSSLPSGSETCWMFINIFNSHPRSKQLCFLPHFFWHTTQEKKYHKKWKNLGADNGWVFSSVFRLCRLWWGMGKNSCTQKKSPKDSSEHSRGPHWTLSSSMKGNSNEIKDLFQSFTRQTTKSFPLLHFQPHPTWCWYLKIFMFVAYGLFLIPRNSSSSMSPSHPIVLIYFWLFRFPYICFPLKSEHCVKSRYVWSLCIRIYGWRNKFVLRVFSVWRTRTNDSTRIWLLWDASGMEIWK